MKKLTAMLAILLALMLTLPCALAENSTTYSLSLLDPVLSQDGETVFDLTGLNVDLVASVTDGAAQALSLELYAGDNYDYITSLQIQLAEEGIVLHLDGMSQSYCLSYDQLAEMMGDETAAPVIKAIAPMVKSMALRSAIDQGAAQLQQATDGMNLDMLRWAPVMGMADAIVLDDEGKCVLPIHVELEEGSQVLAGVRQSIEQSMANSEVNMNVEAFSAEGEAEAKQIRNEADKTVQITLSEANAMAEKLKAEGEAEYMRILSEVYDTPAEADFYEFMRALDMARNSIKDGEKTLVVSSDSPIARVFSALS